MRKILLSVLLGVLLFAGGVFCGKYLFLQDIKETIDHSVTYESRLGKGFSFINPLLECNIAQFTGRGLNILDDKLQNLIAKLKNQGKVVDVAIYYRDLNNGPWFGINEKMDFSPASLLKLPVLMAYYKQAEITPEILKQKITISGKKYVIPQDIVPKMALEEGKSYTVEELLERMIVYSDNQALVLLSENISEELINKVTIDLGIVTPTENSALVDFMTVKDYSGLFRVLFNASYLNQEYSEKALKLLSNSDFKSGIVAGVGKDVVVAHKMGEREISASIKQLHDCGIVYIPNNPYLLCIMTRGKDFTELSSVIRDISSTVHLELQKRN
ncbi:MAG: serine hydrolase [Candidatus Levybacteria bacterium]|nr:serine hydrolase [Candidatus Levybacteria bacterium]